MVLTHLTRDSLTDFASATGYEWLVANGIGGFAAGTVGGANTRRYHGWLIASLKPPLERVMMVAKLDVAATYRGTRYDLGTNEFADGTQSHGYRHLDSFRLEGTLPVWTFIIGDAVLEQRVWMAHGENTTYVTFSLLRGERVALEVTPLCGYRDYHWHQRGARDVQIALMRNGIELIPDAHAQRYRILADDAKFDVAPDWYWNFKHRLENQRGLDATEDLFRPARLHIELTADKTAAIVLTAENADPMPARAALHAAQARQQQLLEHSHRALNSPQPGWIEQLVLAADQYIVTREAGTAAAGATVIAGYPWFGDWGRDTMIALPGLTLTTGRFDLAASILRTFARFVSQGMLPNRFPDAGDTPEYNTVDATLWYFAAVDEYWRATRDLELVRTLFPVLADIIAWHVSGTRYGIGMDADDGLLRSGAAGVQLTWMDAKLGDWVVTPRTGKAVEINALWFNALRCMQLFATELGERITAQRYRSMADRAGASFQQRFWYEDGRYLYDVIDTPEGTPDASLRPNQLFALSLRHPLIEGERARAIVDICARDLWTPLGLRSLGPQAREYAPHYSGAPHERDAVYHQGTVWGWLSGPFALAHFHAYADAARARSYLEPQAAHLRAACLGQMSEIFDGDAPHAPRGCFAQAWSVAETLRAWGELDGDRK